LQLVKKSKLCGIYHTNRFCAFGKWKKKVGIFGSFGSNFPTSDASLSRIVDESRQALAFLSEEERAWIFYRTAEALYPSLAR
jgi:hypothetical protein